jgi:hypothetical protein
LAGILAFFKNKKQGDCQHNKNGQRQTMSGTMTGNNVPLGTYYYRNSNSSHNINTHSTIQNYALQNSNNLNPEGVF